MPQSNNTIEGSLKSLEAQIEKVVLAKNIPSLSDKTKELIVKISPWLTLVSLILMLPLILAAFGISAMIMPFSYLGGIQSGLGYTLSMVFIFGMLILEVMALPGLFRREIRSWRLVFYSVLLSLVQQLLDFNLGGLILGGAISFYILFQVKSKYTK